jgi:ubiquinone/menaquinone biosynthesis C-methylase UbiE
MDNRKEEERRFHDQLRSGALGQRWSPELEQLIRRDSSWSNMKYYAVERKSRKIALDWLAGHCRNKRVLDYCCGNGEDSFAIAKDGAEEVIGIDLSEVSIQNCRERAVALGLEKKAIFRVMDAEALEFEDNSLDVITEYGALHHLNLNKAYSEMARVLKSDGQCICTEALGHNPIIHYYRKRTPQLRTDWEVDHILRKADIEKAYTYFTSVHILGFFHLATLAAVPFRNVPGFPFILSSLEMLDALLLKLPGIKWQAWQIVFVLSRPRGK